MRKTATILFHARQQAHFWHLDTKSFSEHKCLENFYTEILDLTDNLLWEYMGKGHRVDFKGIRMTFHAYSREKMIEYFKRLHRYINKAKNGLKPADGNLANIMDEILGLVSKTLYLFTLK